MVHIRLDSLWVCLLSLTSSLSPHVYLRLVFLAGAYGFSQEAELCAGVEGDAGLQLPWFSAEDDVGGKERLHIHIKVLEEIGLQCAAWHCSVPNRLQWLPITMLLATLKQERRSAS